MSRGLGELQRFILDFLETSRRREGFSSFLPLPVITIHYAMHQKIPESPGLGISVRRASAALVERGLAQEQQWLLPTVFDRDGQARARRWVTCVGLPDAEPTPEAVRLALTAMLLWK